MHPNRTLACTKISQYEKIALCEMQSITLQAVTKSSGNNDSLPYTDMFLEETHTGVNENHPFQGDDFFAY